MTIVAEQFRVHRDTMRAATQIEVHESQVELLKSEESKIPIEGQLLRLPEITVSILTKDHLQIVK